MRGFFYCLREGTEMLPTQDQIDSDKAEVTAAQGVLDAANAQLSADQALIDAAAPHLSVLAEIEAYGVQLAVEAQAEFAFLIDKARSLL
jgi:hypothetical protein